MSKLVRCRDVGFDCECVIRAESEGEALAQAAEHAQADHNLGGINDEILQAIYTAMRHEQDYNRGRGISTGVRSL